MRGGGRGGGGGRQSRQGEGDCVRLGNSTSCLSNISGAGYRD